MRYFTFHWPVAALLCVIVAGCAEPPPPAADARKIADRYYDFIRQGRLDDAVQFYAEKDRGRWRDFLQRWRDKLGALQEVNIHTEETHTTFSGTLYLFLADTRYANGEASEIVTLRTAVNKEGLTLVSHEVDPD